MLNAPRQRHHGVVCRVVIADDVEGVRLVWRMFLEEDPDVEIVAEAGDGHGAITAVKATRPDVLLLDLSMPGLDGLEVLVAVQHDVPETQVVVASGFASSRVAQLAVELGASAYFEKGQPPERLLGLVKGAYATGRAA